LQAPNPLVLNEKVNQELVNIYEWTKANKITVNPNKSYSIAIPPPPQKKNTDAIGSFHFKTDLHGNPMFQILTVF